jgi:BirA family biotin operon repressor/biotin-[acetyl-CoA-carboxylase] ligase
MEIRRQYFETIDSTNLEIKRIAATGALEGTVISAGEQTAGRGRSGHQWETPKDVSLATSILLRPTVKIEHVSRLTLIAAMAVAEAVESLYDLETEIKWPNDILVNRKKICGILTEMDARENQVQYVVVGIGVNVHTREFPEELREKATSLDLELERLGMDRAKTSRRDLDEAIWNHFQKYYDVFQRTEDLQCILDAYNKRLVNREREVRVLDPLGAYTGVAKGMNERGELLVEIAGQLRAVDSGEVSVRGIYGYV